MTNHNSENGMLAVMTSFLMTVLSLSNILVYAQIGAAITAIISGLFAANYYWLKTQNEKKK